MRCSFPGDIEAAQEALDHIEIEARQTPPVLHVVNEAHAGANPDTGQGFGEVEGKSLLLAGIDQHLELEGFSGFLVSQCAAIELPPGLCQEGERLAGGLAIPAGSVGGGRRPVAGKDRRVNERAKGASNSCSPCSGRPPGGGKVRTCKVAVRTRDQAEIEISVDPTEVEQVAERLSNPHVAEDRPPRVENETAHAFG